MKNKILVIILLLCITSLTGCGNNLVSKEEQENIKIKYVGVETIYFNPESSKKCTKEEYENNINSENEYHYKGKATGIKTGCMKWNLYAKNSDNTAYLLLDHNTSAKIDWNSTGDNSNIKELKDRLKEDTKTWNSNLNVRIIKAGEIAKIVGKEDFNSSVTPKEQYFYFDTLSTELTSVKKGTGFSWLYNNTSYCNGCLNDAGTLCFKYDGTKDEDFRDCSISGYWTDTPVHDTKNMAWIVGQGGVLRYDEVTSRAHYGVRPVITVKQSIIK